MAQVSNVVVAAAGGKARFKPQDFLGKQATRKMSPEELRSMAVLAFGPPPKK